MNHLFSPELSWRYVIEVGNLFHTIIACVCLVLLPIQIFSKKGSAAHIRVGEWYVRCAWFVVVTSLISTPVYLLHFDWFEGHGAWADYKWLVMQYSVIPTLVYSLTQVNAVTATNRLRSDARSMGLPAILTNWLGLLICVCVLVFLMEERRGGFIIWGVVHILAVVLTDIALVLFLRSLRERSPRAAWRYFHNVSFSLNGWLMYANLGGAPAGVLVMNHPEWGSTVLACNSVSLLLLGVIPVVITYHYAKKIRRGLA